MELAAITEPLAGEEEAEVTLGERSGSDRRGGSLRIGGGGKDEGAKGVGRIGPAEEKGKKEKVFVLCVCVCRVVGWNRASLFSSCAFGTGYVVTTMCLDGLSPRPMDTQTHTHASIHTAGWRRRERRCTRPPSRASRRKRSGGKRRKKKKKFCSFWCRARRLWGLWGALTGALDAGTHHQWAGLVEVEEPPPARPPAASISSLPPLVFFFFFFSLLVGATRSLPLDHLRRLLLHPRQGHLKAEATKHIYTQDQKPKNPCRGAECAIKKYLLLFLLLLLLFFFRDSLHPSNHQNTPTSSSANVFSGGALFAQKKKLFLQCFPSFKTVIRFHYESLFLSPPSSPTEFPPFPLLPSRLCSSLLGRTTNEKSMTKLNLRATTLFI